MCICCVCDVLVCGLVRFAEVRGVLKKTAAIRVSVFVKNMLGYFFLSSYSIFLPISLKFRNFAVLLCGSCIRFNDAITKESDDRYCIFHPAFSKYRLVSGRGTDLNQYVQ